MQEVKHVKLAGAEVPALEEGAAGVPDDIGGAQQLEESSLPGCVRVSGVVHGDGLAINCLDVNNSFKNKSK